MPSGIGVSVRGDLESEYRGGFSAGEGGRAVDVGLSIVSDASRTSSSGVGVGVGGSGGGGLLEDSGGGGGGFPHPHTYHPYGYPYPYLLHLTPNDSTVNSSWNASDGPGWGDWDVEDPLFSALVGTVLTAVVLCTVTGNVMVLLAVFVNSHLRSTTNYFIVNLAIADLLLGTTVLPFSASLEVYKVSDTHTFAVFSSSCVCVVSVCFLLSALSIILWNCNVLPFSLSIGVDL